MHVTGCVCVWSEDRQLFRELVNPHRVEVVSLPFCSCEAGCGLWQALLSLLHPSLGVSAEQQACGTTSGLIQVSGMKQVLSPLSLLLLSPLCEIYACHHGAMRSRQRTADLAGWQARCRFSEKGIGEAMSSSGLCMHTPVRERFCGVTFLLSPSHGFIG